MHFLPLCEHFPRALLNFEKSLNFPFISHHVHLMPPLPSSAYRHNFTARGSIHRGYFAGCFGGMPNNPACALSLYGDKRSLEHWDRAKNSLGGKKKKNNTHKELDLLGISLQ